MKLFSTLWLLIFITASLTFGNCGGCCPGPQYDVDDSLIEVSDQNDVAALTPFIGDPISPLTGALWANITDINIQGKMLDINFTRTYRGDMDEPGFSHKFYSLLSVGKIMPVGYNEDYTEPDVPSDPNLMTIQEEALIDITYPYEFLKVTAKRWVLDEDCFDISPADPNDWDQIEFSHYNHGQVKRIIDYEIFGTYDPNGLTESETLRYGSDEDIFNYNISPYSSQLGKKWDHSYNISLCPVYKTPVDMVFVDEEPPIDDPNEYTLLAGNGKRLRFIRTGSSSVFTCPSDTESILYKRSAGFELHKKGGIKWIFNSDLRIQYIKDRYNNRITFTYSNENLYRVTNDGGKYITFYYDSYNMIDYITDNFGRTWDYNRDSNFDLTEVVKPITDSNNDNIKNSYTYNNHSLLTMTDGAVQLWQSNTYNSDERITSQVYGQATFNNTYHLDEDDKVDYVYTTDRNGNAQSIYLTNTGLIRKKTAYIGASQTATTKYTYDFDINQTPELESKCLVTEIEMPAGDIYEYEYDNYGNTTSITHKSDVNDEGISTRYTYSNNLLSDLESIEDPQGNITTLHYVSDPNSSSYGNRIITLADNSQYEIVYNTLGQVTDVILPNNTGIHYNYNYTGRIENIVYDYGGLNLTYSISYDARGNISEIKDPDEVTTNYTYDNINRLTEVINALNSKMTLSYNDAGLVDAVSQQLGSTSINTNFEYNKVDKLKKITDSLGRITELTLDNNDNISAVKDPQAREDNYSTNWSLFK